jgi:hypothetical protein
VFYYKIFLFHVLFKTILRSQLITSSPKMCFGYFIFCFYIVLLRIVAHAFEITLAFFFCEFFLRYVYYLSEEHRRNRRDVNFFFKNTIFYNSVRPEDLTKVFILKYFEFTVYILPKNYDLLRRVLYGYAVSDRWPNYRGVYQPRYLKAYASR